MTDSQSGVGTNYSLGNFKDAPIIVCKKVLPSITHNSLGKIPLVLGMRVMVTENVATSCNIVNGAEGIFQDIKFS
ncbi:hypothetical protein SERLA73DRAFT_147519, partial [Serpula lacrymans var. lacrymans S7.3]